MSSRAQLAQLFAELIDADQRDEILRRMAAWFDADDFIIFIRDPELDVLLPAPGFCQTFYDADAWQAFLADCAGAACTRALLSPIKHASTNATGRMAADGSVLVVLGGNPSYERIMMASELLPMAAAALRREQKGRHALVQARVEHQSAQEYQTIAKTLDAARRKLEQALAETKQALRVRDEFVSAASHELRNPLNALQLTVHLLLQIADKKSMVSGEELAARTKRLKAQIDRLLKLVNSLLEVSRISSGRLVLQMEEFHLDALVDDVVGQIHEWPGAVPVRLTAQPVRIRADKFRVEMVITNLLSNAVKYGAGKPVDVIVSCSGGKAFVQVTDRGIGIACVDKRRIFERFERASSGSRQSGFGLGLWITREIVEASGGTISVQSTIGEGSAFLVELPLNLEVHLADEEHGM